MDLRRDNLEINSDALYCPFLTDFSLIHHSLKYHNSGNFRVEKNSLDKLSY